MNLKFNLLKIGGISVNLTNTSVLENAFTKLYIRLFYLYQDFLDLQLKRLQTNISEEKINNRF